MTLRSTCRLQYCGVVYASVTSITYGRLSCNVFISRPLAKWRYIPKHIIVQTSGTDPWN